MRNTGRAHDRRGVIVTSHDELAEFNARADGSRGFVLTQSGRKIAIRSTVAAQSTDRGRPAVRPSGPMMLPGGPYTPPQVVVLPVCFLLMLVLWVNVGSVAGMAVGAVPFVLVGLRVISQVRRDPGSPSRAGDVDGSSTSTPAGEIRARAQDDRVARIAGVIAALEQLDAEWLSYELDLAAYYLTKPLLRDLTVASTAAYRSALYELRVRAGSLGETSDLSEIAAAEAAADAALMAWGAANDHALAIGVSDRSPTERAALRRLHALTAQLADPSTPQPMWSSLIDAVSREMDKLRTVAASWEHLSRVPALQHRNPAAIAAAGKE
ncbi:hypothetical protein [Mycolicibacterium fortuitum]|uniref:hypothetical protein n=1 Tax=Mycolicibacterium fortuitum TaxID=1766 RepID=UPI003AACAE4D